MNQNPINRLAQWNRGQRPRVEWVQYWRRWDCVKTGRIWKADYGAYRTWVLSTISCCKSSTVNFGVQDELVKRVRVAQIVDLSPLSGKRDWRVGLDFASLFIGCIAFSLKKKKNFFKAWTCIHGIDSGSLWVVLLIFGSFYNLACNGSPNPENKGSSKNVTMHKPHLYNPAKSPLWDPILFSESLSPLLSLYLLNI